MLTEATVPYTSKEKEVERIFAQLKPNLVDVPSTLPPSELKGKFVARIFDGKAYYGLLVDYARGKHTVVYNDGDHQSLSSEQVRQSLMDTERVPHDMKNLCRTHVKSGEYKNRQALKPA